jgi:hypothetical protein
MKKETRRAPRVGRMRRRQRRDHGQSIGAMRCADETPGGAAGLIAPRARIDCPNAPFLDESRVLRH